MFSLASFILQYIILLSLFTIIPDHKNHKVYYTFNLFATHVHPQKILFHFYYAYIIIFICFIHTFIIIMIY